MVRIIGSYISPYVRKVLVVLDVKGLSYEIDPIIPFWGTIGFSAVSPIHRIPVLMDDRASRRSGRVLRHRVHHCESTGARGHRLRCAWSA